MRIIVAALAALTLSLAAPAWAQSAPSAAPTGAPAQTGTLDAPAPSGTVDVTTTGGSTFDSPGGLSVVSVFLRADPIVKAVMVILLIASLWSWTIIINKSLAFGTLRRKATRFEKVFWSGQSLDELYQQFAPKADHPMAATFVSALREWRRAFEGGPPREALVPGVKDRLDKAMGVTIMRETDGLERQLGVLATIGSTAPFIGLLGTVIGILNAFQAIATQKTSGIGAVAGGISEALVTTAFGLFVAIPAVMTFNYFTNKVEAFDVEMDNSSSELVDYFIKQSHL